MAHDVFISYSSKDKVVADSVVAALERSNIRCWYAPRDIEPGKAWGEAIVNAIEECKVFLVIFSDNANRSQRVADEVHLAIEGEAVLIPFRIENLKPKGSMKLHLSSRHWLDAYDPSWKNHIDKLVSVIAANLCVEKKEEAVEESAAVIPKETKPRSRIWIPIGILIAAVLIVGGWFGYSLIFKQDEPATAQLSELITPSRTQEVEQKLENTSSPTSTEIMEPALTLTPTLIPDWAAEAYETILTAIENNDPDFSDDFSEWDNNWLYETYLLHSGEICSSASAAAIDGVLAVNLDPDCPQLIIEHYKMKNTESYVLQLDVNFNGFSEGTVGFQNYLPEKNISFAIQSGGRAYSFNQSYANTDEDVEVYEGDLSIDNTIPVRVTLIFSPPVFLVYVDSTLVFSHNDLETDIGRGILAFSFWAEYFPEDITIELDNLKMWDLDALELAIEE